MGFVETKTIDNHNQLLLYFLYRLNQTQQSEAVYQRRTGNTTRRGGGGGVQNTTSGKKSTERLSNRYSTKNSRHTQVFREGRKFLRYQWHSSCYCCKLSFTAMIGGIFHTIEAQNIKETDIITTNNGIAQKDYKRMLHCVFKFFVIKFIYHFPYWFFVKKQKNVIFTPTPPKNPTYK